MDNSYSRFDDSYDDILSYNSPTKKNDSICDQLADFQKLRISALTKAAEISPLVKEVTIGPNSPVKKQEQVMEVPIKISETRQENLIEDKLREDLRYTLIMKKYNKKLQESTEELFMDFIEKMIAKRSELFINSCKRQAEESKNTAFERRRRKLLVLKGLQENDNLSVLEKAKFDEQHSQIINKQTIENMNRVLEEQNRATAQLAAITASHTKVCLCFKELTSILQTEPLAKTICDKYIASINAVIENINIIMESCETRAITDKEIKQSEILAANIERIKKKILDDLKQQEIINKQNEIEEVKKKEIERKQFELQKEKEAKAAEIAKQVEAAKPKIPMFYSTSNYNYYLELKNFLESYENQYKDLLENVNLKKFKFDCQKAVNTPVNALSSVSGLHIKDKYDKLSKLLKGERVQVLDTYVTATQHPQGLYYCTALLAKKIVRQGDLLVSSHPEAAFPLAAVAVALWDQFPIFGKLLEAYFHRYCPYLVPMFLPQKEGQSDKEFYLSRGYVYNDDGVVEKQDKFLKRMSGIFRLHCAIWIAKTPKFLNTTNTHGLKYGWQWIASFINLKPEPDICATLLHDFFTVCGSEFFKYYGKQFKKIIKLVSTEYLGILDNIDEGGPKTRLEVFLQDVLKTGHIPPPNGLLQPNTW